MLTKAGHSRTLLICSDCGHPQRPAAAAHSTGWNQLATVLLVLVLAGLPAGLVLLTETTHLSDSPLSRPTELGKTD